MAETLMTGRRVVGAAVPETVTPEPPEERLSVQDRRVRELLDRLEGLGEGESDYLERTKILKKVEELTMQDPVYTDMRGDLSKLHNCLAKYKAGNSIREILLCEERGTVGIVTEGKYQKRTLEHLSLDQFTSGTLLKPGVQYPLLGVGANCMMFMEPCSEISAVTLTTVSPEMQEGARVKVPSASSPTNVSWRDNPALTATPGITGLVRVETADGPRSLFASASGRCASFEQPFIEGTVTSTYKFNDRLIGAHYRQDWNAILLVGEKNLEVIAPGALDKGGRAKLLATFQMPVEAIDLRFSADGHHLALRAKGLEDVTFSINLDAWKRSELAKSRILVVSLPDELPVEKKGWRFPILSQIVAQQKILSVSARFDTGILTPDFAFSGDNKSLVAGGERLPDSEDARRGELKLYSVDGKVHQLARYRMENPITAVRLDARGERIVAVSGKYFEILGEKGQSSKVSK
jgi:hypothetical protein